MCCIVAVTFRVIDLTNRRIYLQAMDKVTSSSLRVWNWVHPAEAVQWAQYTRRGTHCLSMYDRILNSDLCIVYTYTQIFKWLNFLFIDCEQHISLPDLLTTLKTYKITWFMKQHVITASSSDWSNFWNLSTWQNPPIIRFREFQDSSDCGTRIGPPNNRNHHFYRLCNDLTSCFDRKWSLQILFTNSCLLLIGDSLTHCFIWTSKNTPSTGFN